MTNRVMFIGSKHLGIAALRTLHAIAPDKLCSVVTIDDTTDVRSKLDDFKIFCQQSNKTFHVLTKPSALCTIVAQDHPDVCVVVGWYWVFKKELLAQAPQGFFGIHASLLPKYRGGAPLVWPIINGDKESGVSLFRLADGMDTGDIVAQERFSIDNDDSVGNVIEKARSAILILLKENYPAILSSAVRLTPQDHSQATYGSQRTPESGRVDWSAASTRIHNEIRAQSDPYPGAFCYTGDGHRIYLCKSSLFTQAYYGLPGLVAQASMDGVIVTCGTGAVRILEARLETSAKKPAASVLRYGDRLQ